MRITSIEPQKNIKRVNIFIDDKFAFGLTEEIRFKYSLHIDDEVTQDFIDNILKSEEQMKVTEHALNLLSYRQRSQKEIITALNRKGYEESYIQHTVEYLKKNKFIDDYAYAKSFIADKLNLNGYGSVRIKFELMKKGISKDIIEATLNLDEDEEYEIAMEIAVKKFKSYKDQDKSSIYRKLGGFLQRKGYSFDIVSKVLRELLND